MQKKAQRTLMPMRRLPVHTEMRTSTAAIQRRIEAVTLNADADRTRQVILCVVELARERIAREFSQRRCLRHAHGRCRTNRAHRDPATARVLEGCTTPRALLLAGRVNDRSVTVPRTDDRLRGSWRRYC